MRKATVYILCEPDGTHRYIGVTTQLLSHRFLHHLAPAALKAKSPKARWLNDLVSRGLLPTLKIVKTGPEEKMILLEKKLIEEGGKGLLNVYGGGGTGPRTAASRKRMSKAHLGKPQPWKNKAVIRGDGRFFGSVNEAAAQTGIERRSISNCLNGVCKTSGGFTWRYREVTHRI